MTVQTEAAPKAPQAKPKGVDFLSNLTAGGGLAAVVSWAAGVALHSGFHVSAPFLPTWLLALASLLTVGRFSSIVAFFWHQEKLKTAPQLAAQAKAAEVIAEGMARQYVAGQAATQQAAS